MIKSNGGIKRAAAWMLSVLMVLSQLALPLAALAENAAQLPGVTLYYMLDGEQQQTHGGASQYGEGLVYWLMVPQDAFAQPMGLIIDADGPFTGISTAGDTLYPADARSPQESPAAEIQVYDGDQPVGSYPLFVSSISMPAPEEGETEWPERPEGGETEWPEQPGGGETEWPEWPEGGETEWPEQPGGGETEWPEWPEGGETEWPEQPGGGESEWPEWPEGGETGWPEQPEGSAPEAQPALIVIHYAEPSGTVLFEESRTLYEGEHTIYANAEAVRSYGYELEGGDSVSASIQVYADGTASRNPVLFTIRQAQQEPEDEGTLAETIESEGRTVKGGLRFRSSMSTTSDSNIVFKGINSGTIVWVYSRLLNQNGEEWYSIRYNDVDCYVRADCLEVIDSTEPVSADVTFCYTDENGKELFPAYTAPFEAGTYNDLSLYRYDAPEGYAFSYATAESITVDGSGADPASVTFVYSEIKPVSADVTFCYTDENGKELFPAYTAPFEAGTYNDLSLYRYDAPEGYAFSYATAESITVDGSGADPATVTFVYSEIKPVSADVTFCYTDENGKELFPAYTAPFEAGTYNDLSLYRYDAPEGYAFSYATAESITVDGSGAVPNAVTFVYRKLPDSATLTVRYLDAERNPIAPDSSVSFRYSQFGQTYGSEAYLTEISGYRYAGVNAEEIVIDAYGGITPEVLELTFVEKPKAEASVTFEYICSGRAVASPLTVKLPEGTHDVNEYAANPEGYLLKNVSSQTVTVDETGKASPAVVTFTYEEVSHTAILKVHYRNSIGAELPGSPEIRELEAGEHTITPNAAYAPSGYTLSGSTQSYRVTVGSDLVAYPNSVVFTYYDSDITGSVTVRYYDTQTNQLITSEVRTLAPGVYDLEPNESLVTAKGSYERSDVLSNTKVEVKETGEVLPTVVNFYYKPVDIDVYQGYLLVTRQTALRKQPAEGAQSVATLPVDTVLWTAGQYQSGAIEWNSSQVASDSSLSGWVNGADVRRISADEANARLEEQEQQKEPDQAPGYYITVVNNVPLRRYMDTAAQAKYLKLNTVVYVSAQSYDPNGYLWHKTTYDGVTGYVRDGQLRKLTADEVDEYLSSGNPITPGEDEGKYDANGASSYGYVTKNSVNFRSAPNGTRIKMLNQYAMALILDTKEVNGVTWYNVNYSGQTGWIHGDYFHQMTINEFNSFVGSTEYYKGITNNTVTTAATAKPSSGTTGSTGGSTGSASQGSVSSVEDWNVGTWQNTGATTQASYEPFNPYTTPAATMSPTGKYTTSTAGVKLYDSASAQAASTTLPQGTQVEITGTTVLNGATWYTVLYNGQQKYMEAGVSLKEATATATPTPTPTFVIGTMIPISYDDESKETQTGIPIGTILGGAAAVLSVGAGGVYAYALHQNKRRKAAAARAAASRRAKAAAAGAIGTAGTAAAGAASPYTRRAVAAPPVTGAQQQSARPQQPYGTTGNPYATGSFTGAMGTQTGNPYSRPAADYSSQPASAAPVQPSAAQPQQTNPYARPISPAPAQQAAQTDAQAPRRRATRMQRYHEAGSGEEGNE